MHGFDATLEEVLHLITHLGYSNAYPTIWGEYQGTQVSGAMDIARGGYFATLKLYSSTQNYFFDKNLDRLLKSILGHDPLCTAHLRTSNQQHCLQSHLGRHTQK